MDFLRRVFDTSDFPPRWNCGDWSDAHGWLHILSDLAIFGAYSAIPIALVILAKKYQGLEIHRIGLLFAAFIFACGTTHLIEAVIFWHPIYRFAGVMKLVTALVSWATVIAIIRLAPEVFALRGLQVANEELRLQIQDRQLAERKLRSSEELMKLAKNLASVGILRWDLDGDSVTLDEIAGSLFDLPSDTKLTRGNIEQRFHGNEVSALDVAIEKAAALSPSGEVVRFSVENQVAHRSGEVRWLGMEAAITKDDGNGPAQAVVAAVDRTAQRTHEAALDTARLQAEAANEARGAFLANMSHEIRTPIAAMLGHTEILLRHLNDPDNQQCARTIRRSGEHLLEIINDILDLSKIEADRLQIDLEPTDVGAVIREVASLMEVRVDGPSVAFDVLVETPLPKDAPTDDKRLRQILLNLVGNALKFTDAGHVHLCAAYDPIEEQLIFRVEDTGIGIPHETQKALFEPFVQGDTSRTRAYQGSGLGLAISKRLAERLGGTIELTSVEGEGSTFVVRLPIANDNLELIPYQAVPRTEPDAGAGDPPIALTGRILLVDDRRDIRQVGQHFLEEAGAEVTTAANGREAIEAVQAARAAGHPLDAIVMDIQMPVMDGYEATIELRRLGEDAPIIALTADAMKEDRDRALSAGCDRYLSKPIDPDELVSVLAEVMDARRR